MIRGSCLCGGVRYEAEGPLTFMTRCHCVQCRKASGAEFATNANVSKATFRVVSGERLLGRFEWSPGNRRAFCSRCGSPLFKEYADRSDVVRLRLGCLDTDVPERPMAHLFVGEKPAWSEITDTLPQFEKRPA
ncbi:MAG TPA: GFA family protein [Polyangiaceae bacterium]|nr:GFA family protein [Polyangiaceae bacterium]